MWLLLALFVQAPSFEVGPIQKQTVMVRGSGGTIGTGVIVDDERVLTVAHVAQPVLEVCRIENRIGPDTIHLIQYERCYRALPLRWDIRNDLLLLEVADLDKREDFKVGPALKVGQMVHSFAYPGAHGEYFIGRVTSINERGQFAHIDIELFEGASGGAVFDSENRLVGIVMHLVTGNSHINGIIRVRTKEPIKKLLH